MDGSLQQLGQMWELLQPGFLQFQSKTAADFFCGTVAEADKLLLQWSGDDFNFSSWGTQDKDSSGLMVCVGKVGAPPPASADACLTDASLWAAYPLALADAIATTSSSDTPPAATTQTLTVQLPAGVKPLAVRYGWPINGGDTCCPFKQVRRCF
jgi:hypothetical protein